MGLVDVLRFEMRRLRQEESGVALMLTLSVFLLLYVICAGVYSIGETVRQKIELQNACDSAAYSAAVAQADGLSRMAMINRAMSWTYVQLTNMQIDYITYQWLSLVCKRYYEDLTMCKQNCSANFGGSLFPAIFQIIDVGPCHPHGSEVGGGSIFEDAGTGYFCGIAGVGLDCVRLNGHATPTRVQDILNDLDAWKDDIADYAQRIPYYKLLIGYYNAELRQAMTNMLASVEGTATAILRENLPRQSDGSIDAILGRDFLGHVGMTYPTDPYQPDGGGYFSPLFNTELGERIFLTMADGEVYDELADYFVDDANRGTEPRFGGLDQWFVRSFPAESAEKNTAEIPKQEDGTDLYHNSISALGICRVYKNTNRVGEQRYDKFGRLITYRDHHCGVETDRMPSCINTHQNCPEQCATVDESVALYADYEWSSGRYNGNCTHWHKIEFVCGVPVIKPFLHVHTYGWNFLGSCQGGHQCGLDPGQSHSRALYCSCTGTSHEGVKIPDTPTAFLGGSTWPPLMQLAECDSGSPGAPSGVTAMYSAALLASYASLIGDGFMGSVSDSDWNAFELAVRYANKYKPNGFARIYGDDLDIYDENYYCGTVAQPLILNRYFYDREGAIVVGLTRKQRNPWTFLLDTLANVIDSDQTGTNGIYSAFNPVDGNYLVAFSAARAAHRFHPSNMQVAKAIQMGHPLSVYINDGAVALPGEYETRFDTVCDEDRFSIVGLKAGYVDSHVGCVCRSPVNQVYAKAKGDENIARLSRCWNLCETDWDATLLPLRFALAEPDPDDAAYDSLDGQDITWKSVGLDRSNLNPLQNASRENTWVAFFDSSGKEIEDGDGVAVSGAFLNAMEPMRVTSGEKTTYDAPYSQVEVNAAAPPERPRGNLNLWNAIKNRIL